MKKKRIQLDDLILEMLQRHPDSGVPTGVLMGAFKLPRKSGAKRFSQALEKLQQKNKISIERNRVFLKSRDAATKNSVQGIFHSTRHGSGYVSAEGFEQDIRVPSRFTHTALDRDRVEVQLLNGARSDRQEGKVVDVLERGRRFYVGTFRKQAKNVFFIAPDAKSAQTDFFVHPDHVNGARTNDKVVFRLIEWLHPRALPEAEVLEVLGKKGSNNAEILSILAENDLQAAFPEEVEDCAQRVATAIAPSELQRRTDVRHLEIFTIDPDDAKDFDDALSIEVLDSGNYYLGVHIADVSHYVLQGNVLDQEAYARATSVYLVDRVIPMLPERLSNGVCSLSPDEDKLAYSCFMEITPSGDLVDYRIEESVIHSRRRLTYEQAQAIIEGKKDPLSGSMKTLATLSGMLTSRRMKEGSIDLDTPEPRFRLDASGKPVEVYVKERLAAHRLVEECMLMANKTVSWHISRLREQAAGHADPAAKRSGSRSSARPQDPSTRKEKNKGTPYPFLYRVHDRPDPEKILNIAKNVRPLGIEFKVKDGKVTAGALNRLIAQANQTSLKHAINDLVLRSMAKAVYSPKNIGHYGLGFKEYTHFTSPIRRYPDLVVHRMLKQYAAGQPSSAYDELVAVGEHCSEREKDAAIAERDSVKLKQVEYMSERKGQVFAGVISGVTDKGFYVLLSESFCEGMVSMRDLSDDYYDYEPERHLLRGRKRGKIFRLGDEIRVRVVNTDTELRQIDFVPE